MCATDLQVEVISGVLLVQPAGVRHVKLDPEVESDGRHSLHPHLFPDRLVWVQPSHDVRSVSRWHGSAGVGEHQSEVISLRQLQVGEDLVEQVLTPGLLLQTEPLGRVVKKDYGGGEVFHGAAYHRGVVVTTVADLVHSSLETVVIITTASLL